MLSAKCKEIGLKEEEKQKIYPLAVLACSVVKVKVNVVLAPTYGKTCNIKSMRSLVLCYNQSWMRLIFYSLQSNTYVVA